MTPEPLYKSTNRWSCLPYAFAAALEVHPDKIIKAVGHDGSEIIRPNQPEPMCRRGFCVHEMIDVCRSLSFAVTWIEADPQFIVDPRRYLDGFDQVHVYTEPVQRLNEYMDDCDRGVLCGETPRSKHAIAWIGQRVLDPLDGQLHYFESITFSIESLLILDKIL